MAHKKFFCALLLEISLLFALGFIMFNYYTGQDPEMAWLNTVEVVGIFAIIQIPFFGWAIEGIYLFMLFTNLNSNSLAIDLTTKNPDLGCAILIATAFVLWSLLGLALIVWFPREKYEPTPIPRTDPRSIYYLRPEPKPQPKVVEYEEKEFVCSRCGSREFKEEGDKKICLHCGAQRYLSKKREEL